MPISYCSEWTTASGKIRRAYPGGVEKEVGYTYRGEKIYYNEWTRLQLHVPCHSGDETEDSADGGSDSLATVPPTPAYDWRQPKDYSQNTYSPTPSNRISPEESAARVLGSKALSADMLQQMYKNNPVLAAMLGSAAGNLGGNEERKKLPDITPTKKGGGRFSDFDKMYHFLIETSKKENVELAAGKYENDEVGVYYIVFSWDENTISSSYNRVAYKHVFDKLHPAIDLKKLYHTHPKSSGPSYVDAEESSLLKVPIFILGFDGRIWETERVDLTQSGQPLIRIKHRNFNSWSIDERNPPYGQIIHDINLIK